VYKHTYLLTYLILDLKVDTIIRSLITPQNCINNLSCPILYSSITDFSCIYHHSRKRYALYVCCLCCIFCYITAPSPTFSCKLHACTFITCLLNVMMMMILRKTIFPVLIVKPNTHRRRRRDETVESRRVGGVNTPVGSRDPVYNFLC